MRPFSPVSSTCSNPTVVVCLGGFGYGSACRHYEVRPRPRFGHGVEVPVAGGPMLLCSFHPSQQNTFTRRLTEPMLDAVFARAVACPHLAAVTGRNRGAGSLADS